MVRILLQLRYPYKFCKCELLWAVDFLVQDLKIKNKHLNIFIQYCKFREIENIILEIKELPDPSGIEVVWPSFVTVAEGSIVQGVGGLWTDPGALTLRSVDGSCS